jgi:hypothetical protein
METKFTKFDIDNMQLEIDLTNLNYDMVLDILNSNKRFNLNRLDDQISLEFQVTKAFNDKFIKEMMAD